MIILKRRILNFVTDETGAKNNKDSYGLLIFETHA